MNMLPALRESLDALEEAQDFGNVAPDLLRSISSRLPELASELTSSPQLAAAASHGSYNHPNGFEKLLLASGVGQTKLLLHTWTDESIRNAVADEHSHNHRWPFATLVLMGSYRFETYEVHGPGPAFRYRYVSPGDSDRYALVEDGRATVSNALTFEMRPGCVCVSDSGTIHRVFPLAVPLMTLFIQGPPDRTETIVIADEPASRTGELPLNRLSVDEWETQLMSRSRQLVQHGAEPVG